MKRKSFLILATSSLFIIGAIFIIYIFSATLSPSAKTKSAYPDIDLRKLKPNTFKIYPHPTNTPYNGYVWHILIYKTKKHKIRAWDIPVKNNAVGMPEFHWWRSYYNCKNFGPTVINGLVDENKPITCHDKNLPPWWGKQWRWDINGKNIENLFDNLNITKGYFENGYFKFF